MAGKSQSIIQSGRSWLTHRERFQRLNALPERGPGNSLEFGYLTETIDRWHGEGLPAQLKANHEVEGYFGVDSDCLGAHQHPPDARLRRRNEAAEPGGQQGRLPESRRDRLRGSGGGVAHHTSLSQDAHFQSRRLEAVQDRLQTDTPGRFSFDHRKNAERLRYSDVPVGVSLGSFLGWIRNWVGFENLALMVYDDRDLVEEMVETLTQLFISQLTPALPGDPRRFRRGLEDICFRSGLSSARRCSERSASRGSSGCAIFCASMAAT